VNLATAMDEALRKCVLASARRQEVHAAVGEIYQDLEDHLCQGKAKCLMSGKCCRFGEFGHRMYVTTLELATFVHELSGLGWSGSDIRAYKGDGAACPFQAGKVCGVHGIRPFACRVFFCDPGSKTWQNEVYETFHARLKRLHEEVAVPYYYLEWLGALQGLGMSGA